MIRRLGGSFGARVYKAALTGRTAKLHRQFSKQIDSNDDPYAAVVFDQDLQDEMIGKEVGYAKEFLKQLDDFETYYQIQDEIKNRRTTMLQEPAEIYDGYEYYSQMRIQQDQSYHVLLRKNTIPSTNPKAPKNKTEVVIDPFGDKLVPLKFLGTHSIFTNSISVDQQKCFVVIDIKTDERPTGFIKDIKNQKVYPERLQSAAEGHFNTEGTALLYIQRDEKVRNSRLVFHKLGTFDDEDTLLYQEPDESVWLGLEASKCKQYLILSKVSKRGNELFIAKREFGASPSEVKFIQLSSEAHPIHDLRFTNTFILFEASSALYFIRASQFSSKINKLIESSETAQIVAHRPKTDIFRELEPERILTLESDEMVTEKDLFDEHIVVYLSKISRMKLLWAAIPKQLSDGETNRAVQVKFAEIPLPEEYPFGTLCPGANMNLSQQQVRMHIDTPFVYNKIFDLDTKTGLLNVVEESKISGKPFHIDNYVIKVVYAPSFGDSKVQIPITLVLRK